MRMSKFGDWFEARLQQLGLKQEVLADRLRVEQSTISRWKKGADLKAKHVYGLARELGVTTDEVYARAAGMGPFESEQRHKRASVAGMGIATFGGVSGQPGDGPDEAQFMVFVGGNCLAPELNPGDVLLMVGPELRRPRPTDVVSFFLDGERQIKRVEERDGQLVLASNDGEIQPLTAVVIEGVMVDSFIRNPRRKRR